MPHGTTESKVGSSVIAIELTFDKIFLEDVVVKNFVESGLAINMESFFSCYFFRKR